MEICAATDECGGKRTRKVESGKAGITSLLISFIAICSRPLWKYSCCSCYFVNQVLLLFPCDRNVTFDLVASFRTITIKMSFSFLLPSPQYLLNFQVV